MNTDTMTDNLPDTRLTKKDILAARFAQEYIKHDQNGTRAMLSLKPHLEEKSAATEAWRLLNTTKVQNELQRLNKASEVSAIRTRAEIINRFDELSKKAEKSKSYTPAINATKEIGILSGVYDKEDDQAGKYNTFIGNLTVNVQGSPQDIVESQGDNQDIEAEWESILDNQEVTGQE
jgi:hypothetical protein